MIKPILTSITIVITCFASLVAAESETAASTVEFMDLAQQCAPTVSPQTMAAIVHVESSYNPFAIGVVGGHLVRQPANLEEAIATVKALDAGGWNFSLGVAQVNKYNLPLYKVGYEQAFDACTNLRIGSKILEDCYTRAAKTRNSQEALQAAFSCYFSGNFKTGFRAGATGKPSYVQQVMASADKPTKAIQVVPAIKPGKTKPAPPTSTASAPQAETDTTPVLLHRSGQLSKKNKREEQAGPVKEQAEPRNPAIVF